MLTRFSSGSLISTGNTSPVTWVSDAFSPQLMPLNNPVNPVVHFMFHFTPTDLSSPSGSIIINASQGTTWVELQGKLTDDPTAPWVQIPGSRVTMTVAADTWSGFCVATHARRYVQMRVAASLTSNGSAGNAISRYLTAFVSL